MFDLIDSEIDPEKAGSLARVELELFWLDQWLYDIE
jgi:hypothetical protein